MADKQRLTLQKLLQLLTRQADDTVRVSMLGPAGVGKTSLLATMYDQLEQVVAPSDLLVRPEADDAQILHGKVSDLKKLFATDGLKPDPSGGIYASSNWRAFDFWLGRRGHKPTLHLEFIDYPGNWIQKQGHRETLEWVLDVLTGSQAILIPIDAPALMERNGIWHDERNQPGFIYNLVSQAYEDLSSPRLVVLCPIRCERYMKRPAYAAELARRTHEGYQVLLDHLSNPELAKWVSVVIAPVQTLGEIVFEGSPKDRYLPYFRKTQPDAVYSPVDSEQPLRYVLRFAMRLHHDEREAGPFGLFRRVFDLDDHLKKAAEEFAHGCKEDAPFDVVQGQDWLAMERQLT